MQSRETIVSETLAIIEQLSMFGVLKMWWIAKHIRKIEQKEKGREKLSG